MNLRLGGPAGTGRGAGQGSRFAAIPARIGPVAFGTLGGWINSAMPVRLHAAVTQGRGHMGTGQPAMADRAAPDRAGDP
jgi:hypothetical protein